MRLNISSGITCGCHLPTTKLYFILRHKKEVITTQTRKGWNRRVASRKAIERSECTQQEKPKFRKHDLSYGKINAMPIIQCKCGEKILLIPDLKAMNIAIEMHLAAHRKATKKTKIQEESFASLRQFLIEQLLQLSCRTYALLMMLGSS